MLRRHDFNAGRKTRGIFSSEVRGIQRVESLKCGTEVYGCQVHNIQLGQSYVGLLSSIQFYVGFDTDMLGCLYLSVLKKFSPRC